LSDLGFPAFRPSLQVVHSGGTAGLGETTVLLSSWRLHLEAAKLPLGPSAPIPTTARLFARSIAAKNMPTAVASIRRDATAAREGGGNSQGVPWRLPSARTASCSAK
jgi:hypothetical protein